MYRPIRPISVVNGYQIAPGFYEAFESNSPEQELDGLYESWTTDEQRAHNASHRTCDSCRGRGYAQVRQRNGRVERENVGCQTCLGTGAVLRVERIAGPTLASDTSAVSGIGGQGVAVDE